MQTSAVESNSTSEARDPDVIVVGAGPVGLLTALRLARDGIKTIVLEALPAIEKSPRAMAYQPVAVEQLDRAGVLEDCRKLGMAHEKICWRKTRNQEVIAELGRVPDAQNPYENLLLGQHILADIIMSHLNKEGGEVLFDHRVVAVEKLGPEEGIKVEVEVGKHKENRTFQSKYLVAADGGRSTVRKLCGIAFEGFTWPEQLVSTNVYYPFDEYGWHPGQFMCDPNHWALIGKINKEGLWRVSYGEIEGLSNDQIRDRLPMKFESMFPGPRPLDYKLDQFSPYKLNQRCASTFRDGPVLLAGDAAHLCNPFGGLGLTGGILDAGCLADALNARLKQDYPDSILDKYAQVRREIFTDVVNPASIANKRRLHEVDVDTMNETDPFIKMLSQASAEDQQKMRSHLKLWVDILE